MPGRVDNASPETAYATKDNIVAPDHLSEAQIAAMEERAAEHRELNNPPQPTTRTRDGVEVTETTAIKRPYFVPEPEEE